MGSPRPRMQSPWGQRYQDGAGTSSGSSSPFQSSQSPGLKSARPPPPYPHPKQEKPSPTSQSAAAALQYQAMKAGVKLTPVKKEDELFPAGCVESTQAVHTKKRRLTARDIGKNWGVYCCNFPASCKFLARIVYIFTMSPKNWLLKSCATAACSIMNAP